ncbi:MAG TPA: UvrD-helicase domain-containing protein, partial [bacterium]|nr:UvrD-helicase domain-containing protein [bacterium]
MIAVIPEKINGITPSHYQRAILEALMDGKDNLLIQACAGSGKTATLKMICSVAPPSVSTIAVCFNKSIQQEFAKKLPPHVEAKTLHSVGLTACRQALGRVQVEYKKLEHILLDFIERHGIPDDYAWTLRTEIPRLLSLVLAAQVDPMDSESVKDLAANYDLECSEPTLMALPAILVAKRQDRQTIDFDDMLDHPLAHGYRIQQYDLVLVDEAQDLNAQQIHLVSRLMKPDGRLIAVGDRFQAIYGFRGADHMSMDTIKERFHCLELPLSYCYRCGSSVVSEAQRVVGCQVIQSPEGQHSGIVIRRGPEEYNHTIFSLMPGDLVICRTNAPLVSPCLELIRHGMKATIKGADIGKRLVRIIKDVCEAEKIDDHEIEVFKRQMDHWRDTQVEKALNEGRPGVASYYQDLADTIFQFALAARSVNEIEEKILRIFDDTENRREVSFSSIHRAKGLEAHRVVYLGPEL